jgi:hypothetical protein
MTVKGTVIATQALSSLTLKGAYIPSQPFSVEVSINSTLAMRSCSAMPQPPLRQVPIACNRGAAGQGLQHNHELEQGDRSLRHKHNLKQHNRERVMEKKYRRSALERKSLTRQMKKPEKEIGLVTLTPTACSLHLRCQASLRQLRKTLKRKQVTSELSACFRCIASQLLARENAQRPQHLMSPSPAMRKLYWITTTTTMLIIQHWP